jgi:hypothetical protein
VATYICYAASMVRTTIFLPEEIHRELRAEAFRSHVSMAELIRLRLQPAPSRSKTRGSAGDPLLKAAGICRGPILSDNIDEQLYGE